MSKPQADQAAEFNAFGNEKFKREQYEQALAFYTNAVTLDGSVAKYWTNKSNANLKLDRARLALQDADFAIEKDPSWIKGYYFRGIALERLGMPQEACDALKRGLVVDPTHSDIRTALDRCRLAAVAAHRASVEEQVQAAVPPAGNAEDALHEMLRRHLPASVSQETRKAMDDMLATSMKLLSKGHPTPFIEGDGSDRYSMEALMQYADSQTVQPMIVAKRLLFAGLMAKRRGNWAEAIPLLAAGYGIDERVMNMLVNDHAEALEGVDEWLKTHKGDHEAMFVQAQLAIHTRGLAWTIRQVEQCLRLSPNNPGYLRCLAQMHCFPQHQDFPAALRHTEALLKLKPDDPLMLYSRAFIIDRMAPPTRTQGGARRPSRQPPPGRKAFEEYLAAAPRDHYRRPQACWTLGLLQLDSAVEGSNLEAAEKLYEEGVKAEAALPHFFRPIQFDGRDLLVRMLQVLRAKRDHDRKPRK